MKLIPAHGGVVALAAILRWLWETDRGALGGPVHIGGGIELPLNTPGPASHSWWAMIVLILVDATVFASLLFAYFYIWTVSGDTWPPQGMPLPAWGWPIVAAALWLASSTAIAVARRALERNARSRWRLTIVLILAVVLMSCALGVDIHGHWQTGLDPQRHAYGAVIYAALAYQAVHVVLLLVMTVYTLARLWSGLLDRVRRVTFDNTRLLWHYMVGQGVVSIVAFHAMPRLLG